MADHSSPESTTHPMEPYAASSEAESTTYNAPPESPQSNDSIPGKDEVIAPTFEKPPTDTRATRIDSLKATTQRFISVRRTPSASSEERRPWRSTLIRFGPLYVRIRENTPSPCLGLEHVSVSS